MKFGIQTQIWNSVTVTEPNVKKLKNPYVGQPPFWNSFSGHNSETDRPISVKFCTGKQNNMAIQVSEILCEKAVFFAEFR